VRIVANLDRRVISVHIDVDNHQRGLSLEPGAWDHLSRAVKFDYCSRQYLVCQRFAQASNATNMVVEAWCILGKQHGAGFVRNRPFSGITQPVSHETSYRIFADCIFTAGFSRNQLPHIRGLHFYSRFLTKPATAFAKMLYPSYAAKSPRWRVCRDLQRLQCWIAFACRRPRSSVDSNP
jgi:hypothetical protein